MSAATRRGITNLQPIPDAVFALPDCPVEVCQLDAELAPVVDLYRRTAPERVLEIGTASGGTLWFWLRNAAPGARVVTVDLVVPAYESNEHLYDSWTPEGVTVQQVRGSSHDPETLEACKMFGPYDWLFIDGSHVYEDARMDWDDYLPLVRPGGFVLLHDIGLRRDYGDGTEAGVWRLWREIQAAGYLTREFRADPRLLAYGIGVIKLPEEARP